MSKQLELPNLRREAAALSHFDGFPYLVTKIVPALYHLTLLPAEYGRPLLTEIARRQVLANKLKTCLVFGEGDCEYFDEDGSSKATDQLPESRYVVSGRLAPCMEFEATPDLGRRRQVLAAYIDARRGGGFLFGDREKGGRPATAQELERFAGNDIDGIPKGLILCEECWGWRGECLDPNPLFKGMMMRVRCRCENDNLCARCGRPVYDYKLNANYYDPTDGQIWHVPGFSGLNHVCKDLQ